MPVSVSKWNWSFRSTYWAMWIHFSVHLYVFSGAHSCVCLYTRGHSRLCFLIRHKYGCHTASRARNACKGCRQSSDARGPSSTGGSRLPRRPPWDRALPGSCSDDPRRHSTVGDSEVASRAWRAAPRRPGQGERTRRSCNEGQRRRAWQCLTHPCIHPSTPYSGLAMGLNPLFLKFLVLYKAKA